MTEVSQHEWQAAVSVGLAGSASDDLDRFMIEGEPDYDSEPVPAESLDQANRWLRRIARLDADAAQIRAAAMMERARVTAWETERLAVIAPRREWLARSCEMLTRALWARDSKTATYNVPNGRLFSRAKPAEFVYDDEPSFIAWAQVHRPDLVRTPDPVPAPEKAAVKKAFADCVPKKANPGDEAPVLMHSDDGTVVPVPGVRIVIPDRKWDLEATT